MKAMTRTTQNLLPSPVTVYNLMHPFKRGYLHPVACIRSGSGVSVSVSIVVYYFIQIIRYMFRSYDHLQAEIYTSEINMTYVNFRCIYFHLKMVVRAKYVADNLNKIINY
jgi:hypothetical protein